MVTIGFWPATKAPGAIGVVPPGAPARVAVQLMSLIGIWLLPESTVAGAVAYSVAVMCGGGPPPVVLRTAISISTVVSPAMAIPFPNCAAVTVNVTVGVRVPGPELQSPISVIHNITSPCAGVMVIQAKAGEPWRHATAPAHRNSIRAGIRTILRHAAIADLSRGCIRLCNSPKFR